MKIELDEKYLEILATFAPKEIPRKYRNMAGIGLALMLIGAIIFLGKGLLLGIVIAAVGLIFVGATSIIQSKFNARAKQVFIDYYRKNGTLPPYPEEKSKTVESTK